MSSGFSWLFFRVYHFEFFYATKFKLLSHYLCERIAAGTEYICFLQQGRIEPVATSHGRNDRDAEFGTSADDIEFGCHRVDRIHDIVEFFKFIFAVIDHSACGWIVIG